MSSHNWKIRSILSSQKKKKGRGLKRYEKRIRCKTRLGEVTAAQKEGLWRRFQNTKSIKENRTKRKEWNCGRLKLFSRLSVKNKQGERGGGTDRPSRGRRSLTTSSRGMGDRRKRGKGAVQSTNVCKTRQAYAQEGRASITKLDERKNGLKQMFTACGRKREREES